MNRVWIPRVLSIVMLLIAFNPSNPYGFYNLLRIVLCASFAYLTFCSIDLENNRWAWILGVTAFVYNPIFPVHLTRDIWTVINVGTIILLVASFFGLRSSMGGEDKA